MKIFALIVCCLGIQTSYCKRWRRASTSLPDVVSGGEVPREDKVPKEGEGHLKVVNNPHQSDVPVNTPLLDSNMADVPLEGREKFPKEDADIHPREPLLSDLENGKNLLVEGRITLPLDEPNSYPLKNADTSSVNGIWPQLLMVPHSFNIDSDLLNEDDVKRQRDGDLMRLIDGDFMRQRDGEQLNVQVIKPNCSLRFQEMLIVFVLFMLFISSFLAIVLYIFNRRITYNNHCACAECASLLHNYRCPCRNPNSNCTQICTCYPGEYRCRCRSTRCPAYCVCGSGKSPSMCDCSNNKYELLFTCKDSEISKEEMRPSV